MKERHKKISKNFVFSLRLQTLKRRLEEKYPELKGKIGMTKKGLYRHNPATGFNEIISPGVGKFTGRSPY